ncbi:hypothetical protein ABFS83_12G085900 [Erythranthe nasuta]
MAKIQRIMLTSIVGVKSTSQLFVFFVCEGGRKSVEAPFVASQQVLLHESLPKICDFGVARTSRDNGQYMMEAKRQALGTRFYSLFVFCQNFTYLSKSPVKL